MQTVLVDKSVIDMATIPAWAWLVLGILCGAAELLNPSHFFLLCFGLNLTLVAGLTYLSWLHTFNQQVVWLFGSGLVTLGGLYGWLRSKRPFLLKNYYLGVEMVGQRAMVLTAIPPHETGKVEFQGSWWQALNVGETTLMPGFALIKGREGLMLLLVDDDKINP